jgi:hypothetical protein
MGDAGSHLLGYALAWISFPLLGRWPDGLMAVAAVAPFLFEVTFLIVVRTRRGMAWWRGSPDHFALRMQAAGLSRRRTVALSWAAAAVVGVLASWLPSVSPVSHVVFGAGLAAAVGGVRRLAAASRRPRRQPRGACCRALLIGQRPRNDHACPTPPLELRRRKATS